MYRFTASMPLGKKLTGANIYTLHFARVITTRLRFLVDDDV